MPRLKRVLVEALRRLETGAEISCRAAIAAMAAVVLLQVVLRYVFRSPLVWAEEASVFLMIWVTFIGSGIAIRHSAHMAMTVVVERFPANLARAVGVGVRLAMVAFLLVVAWQGFRLAIFVADQPSPALRIPMIWPYMAIPLGALFMIAQIAAATLNPRGSEAVSGEGG